MDLRRGCARVTIKKGHEIGHKAVRLFPVKSMSGTFVNQQLRILDRGCERLLIASQEVGILVAPCDQGGRRDDANLARMVGLHQPLPGRSPDAGWHLQALLHDSVEEVL